MKKIIALVLLLLVSVCQAEKRPNIIIILADDLGYSDLSSYGSEIQTPNLDLLAKEGILFTQFHNSAKCAPSRGALMTGLYPQQAGMAVLPKFALEKAQGDSSDGAGELDPRAVTIAEVLKPAGYATYMTGKWHLTARDNARQATSEEDRQGWPCQRGFDQFFGRLGGLSGYFNQKNFLKGNALFNVPPDSYSTDLFAEQACQWISGHSNDQPDKPFFMFLSFNAPHRSLEAKDEDLAAYRGAYAMGWDAIREKRLSRQKELGIIPADCVLSPRNDDVPAWNSLTPEQKEEYAKAMEIYAAVIAGMDRGVGCVLKTLEATRLRDNTLILFLSDNGACAEAGTHLRGSKEGGRTKATIGPGWANAANTPFRYWKNTTWEGGTATPLIMSWPKGITGARQGSISREVGHIIDLMPTCVELAKAVYPATFRNHSIAPMEGQSLVPVMNGQSLGRRELFWQYQVYDSARTGDWKITRKSGAAWELFNLKEDPSEITNQADSNPEVVRGLEQKWKSWAKRVGANENGKGGKGGNGKGKKQ